MPSKSPRRIVLAYDLGGTKVAVGAVDSNGKILEEMRVPVDLEHGKAGLIRQLADLGKQVLSRHKGIRAVGVASAGPLDPATGDLLDPTNFSRGGKPWGKIALGRDLGKKLGLPVRLENDAAAAMLAEAWLGAAKGKKNAMILTLGTGLGTGIIANGSLVRAGRGLHPEAGHITLCYDDETATCGCGNLGCAEAYLSGGGFTRRARLLLNEPKVEALEVATRARKGDKRALALFDDYAEHLAVAIQNYATIYCPELIVLTGSFAAASDLFLKSVPARLEVLLARRRVGVDLLPKIRISKLNNRAGLLGGAWVGLNSKSAR